MTSQLLPELLLEIFCLLPLPSLIAAQGVCQSWRHLVPLSNMLPARRALLNLYKTAIDTPAFHFTRPFVIRNLRPFDRKGYIATLDAETGCPDEFRYWILEWPSRAVFGWAWPGFGNAFDDGMIQAPLLEWKPRGTNRLTRHLHIEELSFFIPSLGKCQQIRVAGLEIWETSLYLATWLVLDGNEYVLKGSLHSVDGWWGEYDLKTSLRASGWVEWLTEVLRSMDDHFEADVS